MFSLMFATMVLMEMNMKSEREWGFFELNYLSLCSLKFKDAEPCCAMPCFLFRGSALAKLITRQAFGIKCILSSEASV